MNLTDYFDPVSLERPEYEYFDNGSAFSRHISVHTPDHPVKDLDRHRVVILGVPEDRSAFLSGSRSAPDAVRSHLYKLARISRNPGIYDLGNLKMGKSVNDTYFALRDIISELRDRSIITLILGGSQDLGRGVFLALGERKGLHHILSIDSMLDFSLNPANTKIHSRNYLNQLMDPGQVNKFSFTNLGHQACFITRDQLDQLEKSHLESIRLGNARQDLKRAEPLIRDSEFISIDLGAVKHSDAPAASIPSPNGFSGEELCQFARYAGLSDHADIVGFFEINPERDVNGQTAHLTAQAAWYFLDGLADRVRENPLENPAGTKKFIVNLNAAGHDITFHKSTLSERWWMEIPIINPATTDNFLVSCSYEDYQQACNQEIPDRWWRYLNRLGNEPE